MPSSAITPSPPGSFSKPRRRPRLDDVEHAEHEEADDRAGEFTGSSASVISMPTTSSITTGPGIDAAEVMLGDVPLQMPIANSTAIDAELDGRSTGAAHREEHDEAGRRAERARRDRHVPE